MTKPIALLAAAATLFAAAPSFAQSQDLRTVRINVLGLDLNNPADAAVLRHRVADVTRSLCVAPYAVREGNEDAIARCRADIARQVASQVAARRAQSPQLAQR